MAALTHDMLVQHQETTEALLSESFTVHDLVTERVEALYEACDRAEDWHPLESKRGFVERVLAKAQYPFPKGVSLYDDGNSSTVYEHVTVLYGVVTYTGTWADWAEAGETYQRRTATIWVPEYVLTADGPERYRAETQTVVAAVLAEQERERKFISDLVDAAMAEREGGA
jgi:hypothetical protein